ncbi:hypothetical protein CSC94_08540 [Zhengella mangrovi]|uniref:Uncharacterized protein n=2 Tax=Zhengella mangrovi TaxID=1982044 RepID=A0A2G1QR94_9HYPH|nr:hypothetical protein CSC94_08540 [Zhengella mangrovi]
MIDHGHTVRNSIIDRSRMFRLGPDALVWEENARQGRIPYADVRRVQLISYGNTGGEQYQCALSTGMHGRIRIRSHSYVSLGNFEDRTDTYAPFLRELVRRVAAAAPQAEFVTGNVGLLVAWLVVLLLFGLGLVSLAFAFVDGLAATWKFAMTVAVLLVSGPVIWHRLRKSEIKTFDPANPPLPATRSETGPADR